MTAWELHAGDCRQVLASLPEASVHCVVTSPPYWLLRNYELEPTVWGGSPGCTHHWGGLGGSYRTAPRRDHSRGKYPGTRGEQGATAASSLNVKLGRSCELCGAWLGQLGLEPSPELFVEHLVEVFRLVRRVLRDDGTLWLNLGDSYVQKRGGKTGTSSKLNGSQRPHAEYRKAHAHRGVTPGPLPHKNLVGVPWRVALALQADGWLLRSDIIWDKPNVTPEPVTDRPTKAHEHVFLLSKGPRYFYDREAYLQPLSPKTLTTYGTVRKPREEDGGQLDLVKTQNWAKSVPVRKPRTDETGEVLGANLRDVWTIATTPSPSKHYAMMPLELPTRCILLGTSEKGACATCGAQHVRRMDRASMDCDRGKGKHGKRDPGPAFSPSSKLKYPGRTRSGPQALSTAWLPGCECGGTDEPAPSVVLDPFAGAGSVGIAADRLGRRFVGIDQKPEYVEIANERYREELPLFRPAPTEATP